MFWFYSTQPVAVFEISPFSEAFLAKLICVVKTSPRRHKRNAFAISKSITTNYSELNCQNLLKALQRAGKMDLKLCFALLILCSSFLYKGHGRSFKGKVISRDFLCSFKKLDMFICDLI